MSLRYALLALLTARPLTGYDISKQFGASVGHVWFAPDSQIYPQLRRMEQDGLIAGSELQGVRRKREYRITEAGLQAFRHWLREPVEYQRERDVVHLRAAYLEWTSPAVAQQLLLRHIEFHTQQVQQWTVLRAALAQGTNPTIQARLLTAPAEEHERIVKFKLFAYDGLIARGETEIRWAEAGLLMID